jgi:quinol monooxygenase YgiN
VKGNYSYIWEFLAAPDMADEFARVYGPQGNWVQLFRRAKGYIRSELYRDGANPRRFVTIDHWESEAAWEAFRSEFSDEYEELDVQCEKLTVRETQLGRFGPVD